MKKIGQFFFTFLPFLLVIGIQFLATFFAMGVSMLWEFLIKGASMNTFADLSELWVSLDFNTGIMIIYSLLSISVFGIWYYAKYGGNYLQKPALVFHPLSVIGILMLVAGMQYLISYLISFIASIFPQWLQAYDELLESAGLDSTISVGMFVYSVLLAPIGEELVFRGVTMHQAKRYAPFWAANILQAILFGVFHMNIIQGIYAFLLGLVLGYVCEKGGSIYSAILFHLLFNFWGTVLSAFISIENTLFSFIFWFMFGLVMTVGGLAVFSLGVQKRDAYYRCR